jgi:predicted ATPase
VFRRGTSPNTRYAFKHALVQDAAYSTILISRRRQLRARIVEFIERESEQSADAQADRPGHHALHAELREKASAYLQRSGRLSIDRAAVREVVAQFKQALQAGQHLPDTPNSLERAIDLRNALWSIGGFEQNLEHLNDAEVLANRR